MKESVLSKHSMPPFVCWLQDNRYIAHEDIKTTEDGFWFIDKSFASILHDGGIETFPDRNDEILECRYYFDDWYLYALPDGGAHTYGLFKMREQEDDQKIGLSADGDVPGVTISFVAFSSEFLKACLENPVMENRKRLGVEINRVVAYSGQKHHRVLKAYFLRPQALAPYLIAARYVEYIASFSCHGVLNVPDAYLELYRKRGQSRKYARVPDFLDLNNRNAGYTVCDHHKIYISDSNQLTEYEKLAILATHTGNVSFHSFAAEVRYHAMYLVGFAKVRLPFLGSPYASAIRADMSIGDKEFAGPTPYYNLDGRLVIEQMKYHLQP